jgi:hypothetical protein
MLWSERRRRKTYVRVITIVVKKKEARNCEEKTEKIKHDMRERGEDQMDLQRERRKRGYDLEQA